ncbi:MAG: PAS domain S-box protein [Ignavibacteriales bacterium]
MNILIGKDSNNVKANLNKSSLQFTELYENILETLRDTNTAFIFIDSVTNKILYFNEVFCKMCGYTRTEIFKQPSLLKLISKNKLEDFKSDLIKVFRQKNLVHIFNSSLSRKDNKRISVEITARRLVRNGNTQVLMLVRDVTEMVSKNLMKKLMDEAVHESEKRYRSLIENVKDYAIFMLDFNGIIISWNDGAERILGYKEKEIILKKYSILFPEGNNNGEDPVSILEQAKQERHVESELPLRKKNGEKLWAALTITSLSNGDSASEIFSIIIRDLTKHKEAEDRLQEQENQLRSLAKHLQDAREEERLRIARELHDEFSQMLTALRMDLSVLGNTISKTVSEPYNRISLLEKISSISGLLEKTIRSTRRIIAELRPAVLDELGLYTAIQWQTQEFENRTGIRCKIIKLHHNVNLDKHTSTAIFRILQEGLTNVVKHSEATNVVISLKLKKDNIMLEISDNGKGIDENKLRSPTSTGLLGIRERVVALKGNFRIHSEKDHGTHLQIFVPYKTGNHHD